MVEDAESAVVFVVPGAARASAAMDLARAVCRRAERPGRAHAAPVRTARRRSSSSSGIGWKQLACPVVGRAAVE